MYRISWIHQYTIFLKSDSHLPPQIVLFASIKTLKMMKNAFYFILEVLFVLKLLKFSSWLFGYVEKRLDLKGKVNFKIRI